MIGGEEEGEGLCVILNHQCESLFAFTHEDTGEKELKEYDWTKEEGPIVKTVRLLCRMELGRIMVRIIYAELGN